MWPIWHVLCGSIIGQEKENQYHLNATLSIDLICLNPILKWATKKTVIRSEIPAHISFFVHKFSWIVFFFSFVCEKCQKNKSTVILRHSLENQAKVFFMIHPYDLVWLFFSLCLLAKECLCIAWSTNLIDIYVRLTPIKKPKMVDSCLQFSFFFSLFFFCSFRFIFSQNALLSVCTEHLVLVLPFTSSESIGLRSLRWPIYFMSANSIPAKTWDRNWQKKKRNIS